MDSKRILFSALVFATASSGYSQKNNQPNVLLILTDDQGWGDVHAHGNSLINTPTLDKLDSSSVVLNHFYVSPLSSLSRASLLTGRYHLRTGVSSVQSGLEDMNPEETTLAELFHNSGYVTGCFGKWHNGAYYPYTPNGQGFDQFVGFCSGHWSNYFNPILQRNEKMFQSKGYITDIFTNEALHFIEKNKNKPFFCYVPFNAPHSPYQVPDKYYNKYITKDLGVKDEKMKKALASIYGMVENVDYNVGRLLGLLDKLHLSENTIVIFMSDNGPTYVKRYNGDMKGTKGTVHEGGVRVPCYIHWPSKLTHKIINDVTAHIDILPTLMDFCNIRNYKTNYPIDGISLFPVIVGKVPKIGIDRYIYNHRMFDNEGLKPYLGAVRTHKYRLIFQKNSIELYDINNDPSEKKDIFDPKDSIHNLILEDYKKWFVEVSKGIKNQKDIPVGYSQAKEVRIPAPEGNMYGKLVCYGYPNQNWVNHFSTVGDSLVFRLNVVKSGIYKVAVDYIYPDVNLTAKLYMCSSNILLSKHIQKFDLIELPNFDRVKRDEAYELKWKKISLGELKLTVGKHDVKFYAEGVNDIDKLKIKTIYISQ